MKIVLATFGSRGDVQPMLALSLALQSGGRDVLLAGPPEKAAWAKNLGCPFHPLGSNVTAFIDDMDNAHTLHAAIRFVSYLRRELNVQFKLLPKILKGADLAIGSALTFAVSTVAESLGIAYRYLAFTPQLLPSGHHPFPAFMHQRFPKWVNRMTWQMDVLLDRWNIARPHHSLQDTEAQSFKKEGEKSCSWECTLIVYTTTALPRTGPASSCPGPGR